MAQEVLVKGMVGKVGYGRKKKKVCKGERKVGRRRERATVDAWWPDGGCVGFLSWSWWRKS
jgi:hypothetical protein